MLLTEIRREPAETQAEGSFTLSFDKSSVSLGRKAKELLGYSVLTDTAEETEAPIAKALRDLGIDVLNADDVRHYRLQHFRDMPRRPRPSWECTEISRYPDPIPEFVLNKAVQIKKALPTCELVIEHLTETKDPFLIVQTRMPYKYPPTQPTERYYVEVWDEPKFEGRL